ncbi:ABC transporter, putative [Trypanosoma equiperdum]|uniref:ABC transporter, putative n=1 Tax=Trypanosoma equiperdum TaxID=5694 RepID=A0A1G4I723_TRYEQ|nr:ABC transporter, putative [Trypanosoma equiperdum]
MALSFTDPLVELQSVSFQYPPHNLTAIQGVVAQGRIYDITFQLNSGDRVLVVGHNGSGKSTLLSVVGGRRKAAQGKITVLGTDAFEDTRVQQHVSLIADPWPPEAFFGTTVDKLASPAQQQERKERIARILHLSLQRSVEHMSTGEKRRVQILHGMLGKSAVYLLDECSTDVDVAERKAVLDLIQAECIAESSCCMYATHIFDGVGDWATHIMLMRNGTIVEFKKISEVTEPLESFTYKFLSRSHGKSLSLTSLPGVEGETNGASNMAKAEEAKVYNSAASIETKEAVIVCEGLKFRDLFDGLSFKVYRGERMLLCGCNGVGKSTLLNMMGGSQYFNNTDGALRILGKVCFEDMSLNASIALAGNWWASAPPCEVYVREMVDLNTPRAKHLCELLAVNLNWDVRYLSAGELKRVQLLLRLQEERPIVLLDEATSNLDLDMRHALLSFLYSESVNRGVTVIYVTHIFGGLQEWPTVVMMLDRSCRGLHATWGRSGGNVDKCGVSMDRIVEELIMLKSKEHVNVIV